MRDDGVADARGDHFQGDGGIVDGVALLHPLVGQIGGRDLGEHRDRMILGHHNHGHLVIERDGFEAVALDRETHEAHIHPILAQRRELVGGGHRCDVEGDIRETSAQMRVHLDTVTPGTNPIRRAPGVSAADSGATSGAAAAINAGASASSARPSSVSCVGCAPGTKSLATSSSSRSSTARLSRCREMFSERAARAKCNSSATAVNQRRRVTSIDSNRLIGTTLACRFRAQATAACGHHLGVH